MASPLSNSNFHAVAAAAAAEPLRNFAVELRSLRRFLDCNGGLQLLISSALIKNWFILDFPPRIRLIRSGAHLFPRVIPSHLYQSRVSSGKIFHSWENPWMLPFANRSRGSCIISRVLRNPICRCRDCVVNDARNRYRRASPAIFRNIEGERQRGGGRTSRNCVSQDRKTPSLGASAVAGAACG